MIVAPSLCISFSKVQSAKHHRLLLPCLKSSLHLHPCIEIRLEPSVSPTQGPSMYSSCTFHTEQYQPDPPLRRVNVRSPPRNGVVHEDTRTCAARSHTHISWSPGQDEIPVKDEQAPHTHIKQVDDPLVLILVRNKLYLLHVA
jgi:hypothetical protein